MPGSGGGAERFAWRVSIYSVPNLVYPFCTTLFLACSGRPTWRCLASDTIPTHECISLIATIFLHKDQVKMVSNLSKDDTQVFVNKISEASSHATCRSRGRPLKLLHLFNQVLDGLTPQIHRRCLCYLYRICGDQALLPRSLEIPLCYDPMENPAFHGRHMDVWKGRHEGQEVSAQVFKMLPGDDTERIKRVSCWWRG